MWRVGCWSGCAYGAAGGGGSGDPSRQARSSAFATAAGAEQLQDHKGLPPHFLSARGVDLGMLVAVGQRERGSQQGTQSGSFGKLRASYGSRREYPHIFCERVRAASRAGSAGAGRARRRSWAQGDAHTRDVDSAGDCAPVKRRGYTPACLDSVRGWALARSRL